MGEVNKFWFIAVILAALLFATPSVLAAPRKAHVVVLGAARKVAYSKVGDPAGAVAGARTSRTSWRA